MDNWLKALIAAACVMVCTVGAYYFWGEWRARRDAEQNRARLWAMMQAEPGDTETAMKTCHTVRRNLALADGLNWDADTRNSARQIIAVCDANHFSD